MVKQAIGIGTTADDGTGDTLRGGGTKIKENFDELYDLMGDGTDLSSGISATASVITLTAPSIGGVVAGTQTSATITTLTTTNVDGILGANTAAAVTGTTITANTAVVPDASGGADLGTTSLEWGDVYVADDKKIKFGSDQDVSIEYDEDGTDTLLISGGDVTLSDDKKLYFGTGKDAYIEYDEDGTDTWDFSPPTGGMKILDDKKLFFGTGSDISLEYDETTTDSLRIAATEAAALAITLMADQGDDAGDEWKINIADGGVMTFGNDINSAGTYVTHLTITPNSTASSSTMAVAGNVTAEGAALSSTGKSLILGF